MTTTDELLSKYHRNKTNEFDDNLLKELFHEYGIQCFKAGRETQKKLSGHSMKYVDYKDYITYDN